MVRDYELMYIARPELDDESLQAAADSVERLITGAGGTVVRTTSWGRRRLAYEVDHLRDGHYMLLHLRLEGGRVADVERALAIHETVFRHLLVLREDEEEEQPAQESDGAAAADGATPAAAEPERQTVVAGADEDDEDDTDDDDDEPAALADDDEEEN